MRRGDIYHVSRDPIHGREQAGRRFVLIVSPLAFNRMGTPLVCPITQGGNIARDLGFAVSLAGLGLNTQGVVLCNQPRVLDIQARRGAFIEQVPEPISSEVIAKLITLLE